MNWSELSGNVVTSVVRAFVEGPEDTVEWVGFVGVLLFSGAALASVWWLVKFAVVRFIILTSSTAAWIVTGLAARRRFNAALRAFICEDTPQVPMTEILLLRERVAQLEEKVAALERSSPDELAPPTETWVPCPICKLAHGHTHKCPNRPRKVPTLCGNAAVPVETS